MLVRHKIYTIYYTGTFSVFYALHLKQLCMWKNPNHTAEKYFLMYNIVRIYHRFFTDWIFPRQEEM